MIEDGEYEEFGKTHRYVSIDLSTQKHKNRILDFLQTTNILSGKHEYTIKAKWTADQYHPNMTLSEEELVELSIKLNSLVAQIET